MIILIERFVLRISPKDSDITDLSFIRFPVAPLPEKKASPVQGVLLCFDTISADGCYSDQSWSIYPARSNGTRASIKAVALVRQILTGEQRCAEYYQRLQPMWGLPQSSLRLRRSHREHNADRMESEGTTRAHWWNHTALLGIHAANTFPRWPMLVILMQKDRCGMKSISGTQCPRDQRPNLIGFWLYDAKRKGELCGF